MDRSNREDAGGPTGAEARALRDWPHAHASRFVSAAGLRWHVQLLGRGPHVLMVHGAGGASHSWGPVAGRLLDDVRLVVPDLPGQGLTESPPTERLSLDDYARDLSGLLRELQVEPRLVIAHSAGAAVATRLALDGAIAPRLIVAINPSFGPVRIPFPTTTRRLLGPLVRHPDVAALAASLARYTGVTDRLLRSTGSRVPEATRRVYRRLLEDAGHVRAVLTMMSNWDTRGLLADLPRLQVPVVLLSGDRDTWIRTSEVRSVAGRIPDASVEVLPGLGHLAHEEAPEEVAARVRVHAREADLPL
jgi:magnesium chelatase accessory protein